MAIERRRFGVSIATNSETLQTCVDQHLNPTGRAKGEFMKMNFMIPASLAMNYGL